MWITLNAHAAAEIADRTYVLDGGRVVFSGAAGEFAKNEDRVRALGRRQRRRLGRG